jgi:hypothetical protein
MQGDAFKERKRWIFHRPLSLSLFVITMATPTQDWTKEQLLSDAVSKKDIVTFLHLNATHDFLVEHKLTGKLITVVKNGKPSSHPVFRSN